MVGWQLTAGAGNGCLPRPPDRDDDATLWRRACRDSADSIVQRPGRGNLINFHTRADAEKGLLRYHRILSRPV